MSVIAYHSEIRNQFWKRKEIRERLMKAVMIKKSILICICSKKILICMRVFSAHCVNAYATF